MRDDPPAFGRWLRQDLACRHSAVLREPVPDEMMALLTAAADRT